jgi:small subunit ribosomal protein S2
MQPYIYNKKHSKHQSMHSKIQIIDIIKTLVLLDHTYNFLRDISRDGGKVLFVGTQGQITKEHIKEEAKRVKSYYVNQR